MPRSTYLHCPACSRRKAIEHRVELPIKDLSRVVNSAVDTVRCTANDTMSDDTSAEQILPCDQPRSGR